MELNLHSCHRAFLESYIKKHKLSFKSLANSVSNIASASTLSRITKKDKNGNFAKNFEVNMDTWVNLISNLKLTKEEAAQAILLRASDFLTDTNCPRSNEINKIINKSKNEIIASSISRCDLSEEALCVADTYDKLPTRFKKFIAQESYKLVSFLDEINPMTAMMLKTNRISLKRLSN